MGYFSTNSAICLTVAASPYIMSPLSSNVSNKELVGNSGGPALRSENCYNKNEEIAESKTEQVFVRKQLS